MIGVLAQLGPFVAPEIDWTGVAPQLILLGGALLILLVSALPPVRPPAAVLSTLSIATSVAALAFAVDLWDDVRDEGPRSIIADALGVDGFATFVMILVTLATIVVALLIDGYARREGLLAPELHALALLAAIGTIVMAQANDLIVVFLGLETLSLALYVLAASHPRREESQESAVKYFVLGSFSSAFLLYGVALVYGATGSTNLVVIRQELAAVVLVENGLLLVGMALIVVGLGFKVSAVPFHMWAPDVYQGAPTPMAGFMAATAKIGAFAALIRIFVVALGTHRDDWGPLLWVLAVLSLVGGAVLAVVQTDVKRMLAYSSINHAGFVLIAVETGTLDGVGAALFYLFTYAFLVIGSFGVLSVVSGRGDRATNLSDLTGMSRREPVLAGVFTLLLLSQAGVPFTSGFMGKFLAIRAAAADGSWVLAAISMVSAVVAASFYLRVVVSMWMSDRETVTEAEAPARRVAVAPAAALGLAICVVITLVAGIVPQWLVELSRDAVPVLVAPIVALS